MLPVASVADTSRPAEFALNPSSKPKQVKRINEATVSLFTGRPEERHRGLQILGSLTQGNPVHQSCAGWAGAVQAVTDRLDEHPGLAAWTLSCICVDHEENVELAAKAHCSERLVAMIKQHLADSQVLGPCLQALAHVSPTLGEDTSGSAQACEAILFALQRHPTLESVQREGWRAIGKLGLHCQSRRKRCLELALSAMQEQPDNDLTHEVSSEALATMMWARKETQRIARALGAEDVLETALRQGLWNLNTAKVLERALHTVTGAIAVQPAESCTPVQDVARRGITLGQLFQLEALVQSTFALWDILDTDAESPTFGQVLELRSLAMHPLRSYFIKPLTSTLKCSYVETMGVGEQVPQWMITHWWGTSFRTTIKMLQLHSKHRHVSGEARYWVCTFANNQWDLTTLNDGDILKSPFARAMLSSNCMGEVLLLDRQGTPLSRIWCIFELSITQRIKRGMLPASLGRGSFFLDILAQGTGDGEPITMLEDTGDPQGGWNEVSDDASAEFPLELAHIGADVEIRQARASVEQDRSRILNFICSGKACLKPPVANHPKYDQLNTFVRQIFLSAELYRLAVERPYGCEDSLLDLLQAQANPNFMVRRANTALFAALNADPGSVPIRDERQRRVVELLIKYKAGLNHVNCDVRTALDVVRETCPELETLIKANGGKQFKDISCEFEQGLNEQLRQLMRRAFATKHELDPKVALADISNDTRRSILAAAPILKMYGKIHCEICVRLHTEEAGEVIPAHLGHYVQSLLTSVGCRNKFEIKMCEQNLPCLIVIKAVGPEESIQEFQRNSSKAMAHPLRAWQARRPSKVLRDGLGLARQAQSKGALSQDASPLSPTAMAGSQVGLGSVCCSVSQPSSPTNCSTRNKLAHTLSTSPSGEARARATTDPLSSMQMRTWTPLRSQSLTRTDFAQRVPARSPAHVVLQTGVSSIPQSRRPSPPRPPAMRLSVSDLFKE